MPSGTPDASSRSLQPNSARQRRPDDPITAGSSKTLMSAPSPTTTLGAQVIPRTPRSKDVYDDEGARDDDDIQMSLLSPAERLQPAHELNGTLHGHDAEVKRKELSKRDKRGIVLLIILYLIQGVPVGLAMGSIPFILQEHLSYSQLAVFSFAQWPYSLKLLWSPIVDSQFLPSVGRRKSWIIPMQLIIATIMLWIAFNEHRIMDNPAEHLYSITIAFTCLVFFAATQDIAVDGWALTLLSQDNLSYASTCQTIGLTIGTFSSFTVFLALNSVEFSTRFGIPRLTLQAYLMFWSVVCIGVTLWLLFAQNEETSTDDDLDLFQVYRIMWSICKLEHVQTLVIIHFFAKIGFQANDAVTSLKLVEKGLGKDELAIVSLIDFPMQIFGGYIAARWSIGEKPLRPWMGAFAVRLGFAVFAMGVVATFPKPPLSVAYFAFLVMTNVLSGFSSNVQFVSISAFHTRISDPLVGGTYMTLLNTASNLGGTWPRPLVLKGVDFFTRATCNVDKALEPSSSIPAPFECVSEAGKSRCKELAGTCIIQRDGYYTVSAICVTFGALLLLFYILPRARRLQRLPSSKWRVGYFS